MNEFGVDVSEFTDYEKEHPMELYAEVCECITSMKRVYKLADQNNWHCLAAELDDKLDLMEKRATELMKIMLEKVKMNGGEICE